MRISDWSSDVCSSDLHDNNQEDEYAVEVAKLYNSLRATWERGLEDIAFVRVIQRHRDYLNAKDLKKVSALNEADCVAFATGFKKCCDIEIGRAHAELHSLMRISYAVFCLKKIKR